MTASRIIMTRTGARPELEWFRSDLVAAQSPKPETQPRRGPYRAIPPLGRPSLILGVGRHLSAFPTPHQEPPVRRRHRKRAAPLPSRPEPDWGDLRRRNWAAEEGTAGSRHRQEVLSSWLVLMTPMTRRCCVLRLVR